MRRELVVGDAVRVRAPEHPWNGKRGKIVSFDYLPGEDFMRAKVMLDEPAGHNCYAKRTQLRKEAPDHER